jgi:N-acetylneuraminic acid mutarotase
MVPTPTPVAPIIPRWVEKAALPTARSGLAGGVYEDELYAIGGEGSSGVTGELDAYNPASDNWKTLAVKPTPVSDISAVVIGGKIYVPGGRLTSGQPTDILEVYDPHTNRWESRSNLPTNVSGYAMAMLDGKLYLFGGWDGHQVTNTVYEYSPDSDLWVNKTSMSISRQFAGAAVVNGKILVVGGSDGKRPLAFTEIYSPELDDGFRKPWDKRAPLPEGRYGMGLSSVANILYLVGGTAQGNAANREALIYSYQSDQWQRFENPPSPVGTDVALIPVDNYIYIMGGKVGDVPNANNFAYQAIYNQMVPIIVR